MARLITDRYVPLPGETCYFIYGRRAVSTTVLEVNGIIVPKDDNKDYADIKIMVKLNYATGGQHLELPVSQLFESENTLMQYLINQLNKE